jgi:tripartite-type tricarboxylate transporter receptor subunit TctC
LKRLLATLLLLPCLAFAQAYPNKSVRIVVPFPPGGGTDVVARILAQKLSDSWGQQAVVENKPGASGTIGSDLVAKSAPDGYTLLLQGTQHAINLSLYKQLPYDTVKDFIPVAYVALAPFLLVVNADVPVKNVSELIAYIKSKPGGLDYGSSGPGGGAHLAGEMFKTAAGVQLTHIPYKGGNPALTDLLGGQIPMLFDPIPTSLKHVSGGRLRVLAITSAQRSAILPDIPTVSEAGVPGFEAVSWFGLYAPAGTPAAIVKKLNADVNKALVLPDVKERFAEMGAFSNVMSPEQFAQYLNVEIAKFAKAIKDSGAKVE